jgi:hypothetical protein
MLLVVMLFLNHNGYSDISIKSVDEMFKAMETGFIKWDRNKEEDIRNNINEFFKTHPDGIITFG